MQSRSTTFFCVLWAHDTYGMQMEAGRLYGGISWTTTLYYSCYHDYSQLVYKGKELQNIPTHGHSFVAMVTLCIYSAISMVCLHTSSSCWYTDVGLDRNNMNNMLSFSPFIDLLSATLFCDGHSYSSVFQ